MTHRALASLLACSLVVHGAACAGKDDPDDGRVSAVGDGAVPGEAGSSDAGAPDGALGDGSTTDANVPAGDGSVVPTPTPRPDVHVLITADNAYGFGYGSADAMANYFMGIEDNGGDIFECSQACGPSLPACTIGECDAFGSCNEDRKGAETYVVPGEEAQQDGYLYVIVWSDESVTQGLIGQFRASDGQSPPVYTGSSKWEVCATGVDVDLPAPDPALDDINAQITRCNAGDTGGTFSGGWIGSALGNNPKGDMELAVLAPPTAVPFEFSGLCQAPAYTTGDALDAEARWMGFDDDRSAEPDAFHSNGDARGDFLIFRLPIAAVIILR